MFLTVRWYIFFFLLPYVRFVCNSSICHHDTANQIIVVALLSLHDETTDCSTITLRGIQQMAVLEKTTLDLNNRDAASEGMSLVLHVVNTCTPAGDEIDVALKSLVVSHQTCLNPPLLLGFMGPENHIKLQAIQKITSEFRKFHVLPFAPKVRRSREENSVVYVENSRFQLRSKIMVSVLNQLKWRSVYVIVGDSVVASGILDYLLKELDHVCVTGVGKIPNTLSALKPFYSSAINEFQESGAEGIVIFADDLGNLRPLLQVMDEYSFNTDKKPPFIFYMYRLGLKSWELPRNYTILLLQETSVLNSQTDLKHLYNKTLWHEYIKQNNLDYRRDVFGDLLDSTVAPFELGLKLLWNAAKYAKKIKCSLGTSTYGNSEVCNDFLHVNPLEWKTYMHKASYYDPVALKKISFDMDVSLTVKIYLMDGLLNSLQLIGHITEVGITDLKMNLQTVISPATKLNPKRCLSSTTRNEDMISFKLPIDHDSNWLAVVSKKMKNLIRLEGIVSPEINDKINACIMWLLAFVVFVLGLVLLTKCVYRVFRVRTAEEEVEIRRRKQCRGTRFLST